jgi:hypothetical protein
MVEEVKNETLPTVITDGFDGGGADRLIRGVIVRCVEGVWKDTDGTPIPPDTKLVAWATTECLQRWKDKQPAETILKRPGAPLPDLDELNAGIPQKEWENGIDDKPRPPWVRQQVVYLLDAHDGGEYTFISGTVGAAIAVERLKDKTKNLRMLRGDRCVPIVTLGNKLMATKFGSKLRPEFVIQEWRTLSTSTTAVTAQSPAAIEHVGEKVESPTLEEELNDEIGF